jgi:hypothetical protein
LAQVERAEYRNQKTHDEIAETLDLLATYDEQVPPR